MSMRRGFASAALTALSVISVKVMRLAFLSLSASSRCQAMASPSRSGSGARNTQSAVAAALRNLSTIFRLPFTTSNFVAKS